MVASATVAIIGIVLAIIVTLVVLILCFIIYCCCCMRLQDDTNVRKRILGKQNAGFVQDQTVVEQQYVPPPPMPAPEPMPIPVRREVIREVVQPPPPPQPEVVVHEVVHRYEPPTAPQEIYLPSAPVSRVVQSSACAQNDEWVMIKKKKRTPRVRTVQIEDSSSDEEVTRYGYANQCVSPRLAHYDLAVPCGPCAGGQRVGVGMGMGSAAYMVGARPVMAAPMVAATPVMMAPAIMSTLQVGSNSFQPNVTYGVLPRM